VPPVLEVVLAALVTMLCTLLLYLCFVEVPPVLEVALAALLTLLSSSILLLKLCFVEVPQVWWWRWQCFSRCPPPPK
jgi:hypothetical protein